MEFSNLLTDISCVNLAVRENSPYSNKAVPSDLFMTQSVLDGDTLILSLNVNSEIKLFNALSQKFLPPLDLSYLGSSVPATGTCFWAIETAVEASRKESSKLFPNQVETNGIVDTSTGIRGSSEEYSISTRYAGLCVSEMGEVFYIDPSNELRRRLFENTCSAPKQDPLHNMLVGTSYFLPHPNSSSVLLSIFWEHSVALKRLIVSNNQASESDIIAGTDTFLYKLNMMDRNRVLTVGILKSGVRSRTNRLAILTSDGTCFIVCI